MLDPDYLEHITDDLMRKHIEKAIDDIITDAARRIIKTKTITETVNWQVQKLQQLGAYHDYVLQELSKAVRMSQDDLLKLFNDVAVETLRTDDKIYRAAGYDPLPLKENAYMQNLIWTSVNRTNGTLENLTRTTANTAARQFEGILDQAHFRLASGAFSLQEVVRWGVKDLAGKGIASILYPSGHIDYCDVAFRRATITGLNQAGLALQERRTEEMGCDYVETTAHAGARPSHALWQGRVFKLHGSEPGYPNFYEETGYGTGAGLGGWNCRHGFYPFFPGLSEPANTKEYLDELNTATVTYNGKKMSMYDATQVQRSMERNIRRWKREYNALSKNGQDATGAALKLKEWREREADFLRQTKLPYQGSREQVVGFGRSEAAKATWAAFREEIDNIERKVYNEVNPSNAKETFGTLPFSISAATTQGKIQGYLLNSNNDVGKHKARVINSVLGYHYENWNVLSDLIYSAVQRAQVTMIVQTQYGVKYTVPIRIKGLKGKSMILKTVWQIDNGNTIPRFITSTFDKKSIRKDS